MIKSVNVETFHVRKITVGYGRKRSLRSILRYLHAVYSGIIAGSTIYMLLTRL